MLSIAVAAQTQPVCRVAIDLHIELRGPGLRIGGDIAQLRITFEPLNKPRNPNIQIRRIDRGQRVLKLRPAHLRFHADVLHRLHVESDARHIGQLILQAADDFAGGGRALLAGLQIDLDAAAVGGQVDAVDADKG